MTYDDALRHHVERSLARDLEIPQAAVLPDRDGDYCHQRGNVPVWVSPWLHADPPLVRVWAAAADGVRKTVALLTELNQWNELANQTRFVLSRSRVVVCQELVVESIEAGELGAAIHAVADHAQGISEIVCSVFGGRPPWELHPSDELRQGPAT